MSRPFLSNGRFDFLAENGSSASASFDGTGLTVTVMRTDSRHAHARYGRCNRRQRHPPRQRFPHPRCGADGGGTVNHADGAATVARIGVTTANGASSDWLAGGYWLHIAGQNLLDTAPTARMPGRSAPGRLHTYGRHHGCRDGRATHLLGLPFRLSGHTQCGTHQFGRHVQRRKRGVLQRQKPSAIGVGDHVARRIVGQPLLEHLCHHGWALRRRGETKRSLRSRAGRLRAEGGFRQGGWARAAGCPVEKLDRVRHR